MRFTPAVSLGIVFLLLLGVPAQADDLAWSITGAIGSASYGSPASMEGMEFTPTANITVTSVGWYDDTYATASGLALSHEVGIWRLSDTQLLASAVVPAGTGAPLVNYFRFQAINPLALTSGVTYVIAGLGHTQPDPDVLTTPGSSLTVSPVITIGDWRTGTSSFSFPTYEVPASTRIMGPTFQYVPEPATFVFLVPAALIVLRRRGA
jgi:hypothetical protein